MFAYRTHWSPVKCHVKTKEANFVVEWKSQPPCVWSESDRAVFRDRWNLVRPADWKSLVRLSAPCLWDHHPYVYISWVNLEGHRQAGNIWTQFFKIGQPLPHKHSNHPLYNVSQSAAEEQGFRDAHTHALSKHERNHGLKWISTPRKSTPCANAHGSALLMQANLTQAKWHLRRGFLFFALFGSCWMRVQPSV